MYIDFHTHVFPEKIAEKAVNSLTMRAKEAHGGKDMLSPCTDGTLSGLKAEMKKSGVKASVIMPVVTAPRQFDSINAYAAEINGKEGIYSFGGIHPDCENPEEKLDYIKSLGLKGVKMHPAYQNCVIEDRRFVKIARHCMQNGIYMLFHAGYDIAFPETDFCTADGVIKAFGQMFGEYGESENPHVILAHLGGLKSGAETLRKLCGLPVYLDLACTADTMSDSEVEEIIKAHGAERILFASDCPWQSQTDAIRQIERLNLTEKEKELIAHINAEKILLG